MTKEPKHNRIKQKLAALREKYHLSIVNKDLFVEVYSLQVSKGKFYLLLLGLALFISFFTFALISFSPLKRFVPGYESDKMHQKLIATQKKLLVMEQEIAGRTEYALKIDSILNDFGVVPDSVNLLDFEKVERMNLPKILPEQYINSSSQSIDINMYHFFKPVNGLISKKYNPNNNHFGIDIVTEQNEPVKAVLSGKVLVSAWTAETGYIIVIQHSNQIISVYKHNSVLLKKEGELVKAGEVIAIVGNSGELTTGPHLHLEIWQNQSSLNPGELINFD